MSYEREYHLLKTQLADAQDEADGLKEQIGVREAKWKNGGRVDWIWVAQSKAELRTRNRKVQELHQDVARMKKEYLQNQYASLERCFMDICKKELPIAVFDRFIEAAKVLSADINPKQNYAGFDEIAP